MVGLHSIGDESGGAQTGNLVEDDRLGDPATRREREFHDRSVPIVHLERGDVARHANVRNGRSHICDAAADRNDEEEAHAEHQTLAEHDPQDDQRNTGSEGCPSAGGRHQRPTLIPRRLASRAPAQSR